MQADPGLHFASVVSTTAKASSRLQGHAGWTRPSLFTNRFYNSQDPFHEQWRPGADCKDMQADPDLHFSIADSISAKIPSMNSKGLGEEYKAMQADQDSHFSPVNFSTLNNFLHGKWK